MAPPQVPPKKEPRNEPPSGKLFEKLQNQSIIFSDLAIELGEEKVARVLVEIVLRNGTTVTYSRDLIEEELMSDDD